MSVEPRSASPCFSSTLTTASPTVLSFLFLHHPLALSCPPLPPHLLLSLLSQNRWEHVLFILINLASSCFHPLLLNENWNKSKNRIPSQPSGFPVKDTKMNTLALGVTHDNRFSPPPIATLTLRPPMFECSLFSFAMQIRCAWLQTECCFTKTGFWSPHSSKKRKSA